MRYSDIGPPLRGVWIISVFLFAGGYARAQENTAAESAEQAEPGVPGELETAKEGEKEEEEEGEIETVFEEEETVITGTRTVRPILDAPIKTEVINKKKIENKGATNLVEALSYETGLRLDNQCSVCNTTTVKISGVPGRYSLLLINGMPVYSSLGMTYGLLNIAAAEIEKIEIVHGASSILYGTDAIGGVINVITRKPSKDPHGNFLVQGGMFGSHQLSGYGSMSAGKFGLSIVATHTGHDKIDWDEDGINEYAGYVRSTAAGTATIDIIDSLDLMLRFAYAQEKRQGGGLGSVLEVLDDERRLFSETIFTDRIEGGLVLDFTPRDILEFETVASFIYHDQDSDYEGEIYHARQYMLFLQESIIAALHARYDLVGGVGYRMEYLKENLAEADYTYHMPGVFIQGDWRITDHVEFVHGARYDYHNDFGSVFTGRGSFKLSMLEKMFVVRASVGSGFRAPTTFYEYAHGVRPEGYKMLNETDSPEQSIGTNISATLDLGRKFQLVAEYGMTRIYNPITVDLTEEGNVVVFNVDEPLDVHAIEAKAQTQAARWLLVTAGYGYYQYVDRGGALVSAPPVHQLTAAIQLNFRKIGLKGSLFAEVFSPMELEKVYGPGYNAVVGTDLEGWLDTANADLQSPKRKKSPWYGVVNLRLEQRIYKGLSAYAGIDNIFDYIQARVESPLYYPADDNGRPTAADVVYIWGPLRGRYIYGGLKLKI